MWHEFRGTAAQKSRYGYNKFPAQFSRHKQHLFGTVFEDVRLGFNAVRSAKFRHRILKCMAGVFAEHSVQIFGIKICCGDK